MASYRGHLTFSTSLGIAYGGLAAWELNVPLPVAGVGGLLTALGGLLPDLDSDSGKPVRELFGLAAATVPLLLLRHLAASGLTPEETFLTAAGIYAGIRYGLASFFKHITVHRGMYHSLPAMVIAGLVVFLAYRHPVFNLRAYVAVGVMVGFLSHLVLDELCSVDFRGLTPKLNAFAGSAVKMYSKSWSANFITYALMFGLGYVAYGQYEATNEPPAPPQPLHFEERPPVREPFRWRPLSPSPSPSRPAPTASIPGR